jgi:leishmanolysin-like peptidase
MSDLNISWQHTGIVSICLDRVNLAIGAPVVSEEEIQRLISLYLGEMAVALGATSDLFGYYKDVTTGKDVVGYALTEATCLDGSDPPNGVIPGNVQANTYGDGKTFFEITTPTVTQVVRNIFNCQSMTGARLENQPFKPSGKDGTCIGDGWDMRLFHEEVLSNHVRNVLNCIIKHFTLS